MKIRSTVSLLLAIATPVLFSPIKPAQAGVPSAIQPTADLSQALAGTNLPLSLKLKELNSDWRRLTLGEQQSDLASLIPFLGSLMEVLVNHTFYTQGKTVNVGSETFLVVYRVPGNGISLASLAKSSLTSEDSIPEVTPETALSLSLLNLSAVKNLGDIQIFDLEQELANYRLQREVLDQGDRDQPDPVCPPQESETVAPSIIQAVTSSGRI
ncbi:MAG: hypothetical protein KME35_24740 [Aphanocapsa sp. GSE-SYN-MK-11-07L]|jgi:hypothetical protein|nr:hypothetical protein [Aphanocapsa sp. GSE-SYN-MK-11-07L]